jgi:hypothetical protein
VTDVDSASPTFDLVVDVRLRRPACVLLQAVWGGHSSLVSELFDAESWLVGPTGDMKMLTGTKAQWEAFARQVNARKHKRIR